MKAECEFCAIAPEEFVFEDEISAAFLDHRPLFPGHVLLIPKQHCETLGDLPPALVGPFFRNLQILSGAVETAMGAEGSFVAVNNRVSQSVPHLHVHIVPRRKKDGLRGFFWPRGKYTSADEKEAVRRAIRSALETHVNG
ncbi:MAG TPA: HIT family protein [Bryobacteraceae bacterium]|nr:HIT family protein [Bryobacteraceae bacterium]